MWVSGSTERSEQRETGCVGGTRENGHNMRICMGSKENQETEYDP